MGAPTTLRCVDSVDHPPPIANNIPVEENESESSSEEDIPPMEAGPSHRPITRSVSAKRGPDEMDDGGILSSPSPPRPRKVQKRTGKPGILLDHVGWLITNLLVGPPSGTPLFVRSSSPELIEVGATPNVVDPNASSHLDKGYFLLENPWSEEIVYF